MDAVHSNGDHSKDRPELSLVYDIAPRFSSQVRSAAASCMQNKHQPGQLCRRLDLAQSLNSTQQVYGYLRGTRTALCCSWVVRL